MRRRSAVSNSPASLLRRFGSSTVARFVLIRSFVQRLRTLSLSAVFFGSLLVFSGLRGPVPVFQPTSLDASNSVPEVPRPACYEIKQASGHEAAILRHPSNSRICQGLAPSNPFSAPLHRPPQTPYEKYFAPSRKEHAPPRSTYVEPLGLTMWRRAPSPVPRRQSRAALEHEPR